MPAVGAMLRRTALVGALALAGCGGVGAPQHIDIALIGFNDLHGNSTEVITKGRHDPCVGIRAAPIAEALLALVVMDHALRHRAQCGGVAQAVPPIAAARP